MATDPTLNLRRALVVALRADPAHTALVPATNIYGPRSPADTAWPFERVHVADAIPHVADGYDGADMAASVHIFTQGADESNAATTARRVAELLDDAVLTKDGYTFMPEWRGTQTFADNDEATQWHSVVTFRIAVDGV